MAIFKVFISSVQKEFTEEREALFRHFRKDALLSAFFEPILFEKLSASGLPPDKVYIQEVEQSDLFLGLMGADYGYEDANGVSPSEHEYDHARALNITRLIFIKGGNDVKRHSKENAFIRKVGEDVSRKRFETINELLDEVDKCCVSVLQHKGLIAYEPFDSALHPDATLNDIEEDKIHLFVRTARSIRGFPLREGATIGQVLTHMNLWRDKQLTNSALLVFGSKPQKFFPAAIVKCAHFHGIKVEKPIPDHKVFQGDAFEQVDQAVDFVLSKINVSVGTRDDSIQAPVHYEIPRAAVTEAIVNAVAHRNYSSNGSVQVMLFSDRLEITNPGTLAQELTLSSLKTQHGSYPTNPILAECLYLTGYIERFGTGTLEMIRLSEEAHLHEPDFSTDEGFKIILWRPSFKAGKTQPKTGQVTGQVTDQVTDQVGVKFRSHAGDYNDLIYRLVYVISKSKSRPELMAVLDLRHSSNFRDNYLRPALEAGYIEMTNPESPNSPQQRYRLTKKGHALKRRLTNK